MIFFRVSHPPLLFLCADGVPPGSPSFSAPEGTQPLGEPTMSPMMTSGLASASRSTSTASSTTGAPSNKAPMPAFAPMSQLLPPRVERDSDDDDDSDDEVNSPARANDDGLMSVNGDNRKKVSVRCDLRHCSLEII